MKNEKIRDKILTVILVVCFLAQFAIVSIQANRLVKTRQQLDAVRMELTAATDKQQQLREIVRGTNEILSESFTTVKGIREQIAAIRESYEEMENILYNCNSNDSTHNNTNLPEN